MPTSYVLVLIALLALTAFSIFVALPLWSLLHCIFEEKIPLGRKVLWVLLIVVVYPLGGLFYGILGSKKKSLQIYSGINVLLITLLLCGILGAVGYFLTQVPRQVEKIQASLSRALLEKDLLNTKHKLTVLEMEAKGNWLEVKRKVIALDLIHLLQVYLKDNNLTEDELNDWVDKFEKRQTLEHQDLDRYIHEIDKGSSVKT